MGSIGGIAELFKDGSGIAMHAPDTKPPSGPTPMGGGE